MKKLTGPLLAFAVCLWAADFWQAKPFTEWSDKDLQKMLNNSPWAKPISVPMSGPTPPTVGGAPAGASSTEAPDTRSVTEVENSRRAGRGGGAPTGIGGDAAATLVLRWQTALPVKQAQVRLKYGAEATTSAEAKQILERQENTYLIVLSGPLRPFLRGEQEALKKALMDRTSLSVKGKDALKPSEVQFGVVDKAIEAYFVFPRSAQFTLDDKEVEFSSKIGDLSVKNKFRLKDMVINGKLEL